MIIKTRPKDFGYRGAVKDMHKHKKSLLLQQWRIYEQRGYPFYKRRCVFFKYHTLSEKKQNILPRQS